MKHCWMPLLFLGAGCAAVQDGEGDEKRKEQLKSGAVTHLAFSGDGRHLVAVNEPNQAHCRLRTFSTADWKPTADTGKLFDARKQWLGELVLAPCTGKSWMFRAEISHPRSGGGTANPWGGPAFYQFDPVTLERKPIDLIQQGRDNFGYKPSALARAGAKPLCAVHLMPVGGGRGDFPAFVFDLRAGKKTVELQDFPIGPFDNYFMKTVLEFTPDDTHIVSCQPCRPFQLQLHAADTGKLVKALELDSPVGALQFSPDGKLLAAHCWDGTVLLLAPDLSKQIHALKVQQHIERLGRMRGGVAFAGNGHLAVVTGSLQVELFETQGWKAIRSFGRQKDETINLMKIDHVINSIAASPDGRWLAAGYGLTGNSPGKIRVFEVRTGITVVERD